MPLLVDMREWIEWLTDETLASNFFPYLKDVGTLIVPTSLQFELHVWTTRERDEKQALEAVALTELAGRRRATGHFVDIVCRHLASAC